MHSAKMDRMFHHAEGLGDAGLSSKQVQKFERSELPWSRMSHEERVRTKAALAAKRDTIRREVDNLRLPSADYVKRHTGRAETLADLAAAAKAYLAREAKNKTTVAADQPQSQETGTG